MVFSLNWAGEVEVCSGRVVCFGGGVDWEGRVWSAVGRPGVGGVELFVSCDGGGSWEEWGRLETGSEVRAVEVVCPARREEVFVFYLATAGDGDLWVAALNPARREWQQSSVCVGPDTVDDFAVAVDSDSACYLYCLFANEQRAGLNGHFTRSLNLGRTWETTQDWWNCLDPSLAKGDGSTVHAAWRDAAGGRRVFYSWNRHYGAAANWGQLYSLGGGGLVFGPEVVVADSEPEWFAGVWVFWSEGRRDSSMRDIEFAFSTDGGWSWSASRALDSSWVDEWFCDVRAEGKIVDLCYLEGWKGENEPVRVVWRSGSRFDPGFFSRPVSVSAKRVEAKVEGCRPRVVEPAGSGRHEPGFLFSRAGGDGVWFARPFSFGQDSAAGGEVMVAPNPCRAGTVVRIFAEGSAVEILDAAGRRAGLARNGIWDCRDETGRVVPAGVYLLRSGPAWGRVVVY